MIRDKDLLGSSKRFPEVGPRHDSDTVLTGSYRDLLGRGHPSPSVLPFLLV